MWVHSQLIKFRPQDVQKCWSYHQSQLQIELETSHSSQVPCTLQLSRNLSSSPSTSSTTSSSKQMHHSLGLGYLKGSIITWLGSLVSMKDLQKILIISFLPKNLIDFQTNNTWSFSWSQFCTSAHSPIHKFLCQSLPILKSYE